MSPAADAVIRRLDGTRQKWWLFTLLSTAVLALCASGATLLMLMLVDAVVVFPQLMLIGVFSLWIAATLALIVMVGRRLVRSHRSLEATARRVEYEYPELGSSLINIVQLANDSKNVNHAFCDAAVKVAAAQASSVPWEGAAQRETRWGRFLYCMQTPRDFAESVGVFVGLTLLFSACFMAFPRMGSAFNRVVNPFEFNPSVGSVKIVEVKPGNIEVLNGQSVEVKVEIKNPSNRLYKATLLYTVQGDRELDMAMLGERDSTAEPAAPPAAVDKATEKMADGKPAGEKPAAGTAPPATAAQAKPDEKAPTVFKATIPSIVKPIKYRIEVGDSQTPVYTISVREKPTVAEVEVKFHYPPYLGRSDDVFMQKTADLEAPQYTVAELHIKPTTPVKKGFILSEGQQVDGAIEQAGMLMVAKLPLLKDMTFTINLINDAGHRDPDPRINHVKVLPDSPPSIQILKPGRQSSGAPGDAIPVMVRAGDDHAVGKIRLEMKVVQTSEPSGDEADKDEKDDKAKPAAPPQEIQPPTMVAEWTKFEGTTSVLVNHRLEIDKEKVKPGQTVMFRAIAWDKRDFGEYNLDLKPQQTASDWHSIRMISEEQKVAGLLQQLDSLREQVRKIFEQQVHTRVKTALLLQKEQAADQSAGAGEVRAEQVELQKKAAAVVESIGKTDKPERLTIKKVLNQLSISEMVQAVSQGDDLVKAKAAEEFKKPAKDLMTTQDKIIEVLAKLLDVARKAQAEVLAETPKRPTGTLPDDVKQKFEEAKAKIEEFRKAQKKVIEATEDAAKTPVEDFKDKEEQELMKLASTEDDWAKFMKDFHSDLSKLPDQDLSNGTLAKELVEIQTELKMAEDALLKKSADIAVPLEQLGYEMAKEIATNMEKWLPDTPDREKWSQEESLSDKDKEAPEVELPGELEDLIGELMESEEDLFDEMEDVSSSAIDSLDKGAGWDATDGPISNNSAKGVTGNRLPNTNEIAGRSGEGRQGKSSGEFVGDEAVGKGGRNTPSRLTPDPYMKGQIKDHSKDPVGGATGGGKESGQGGEGLEGPAPNQHGERDMARMADKQAALRNKAGGLDANMQVTRYHKQDIDKLLDLMSKVERELKAGNYQNALRQKQEILGKLKDAKQFVEGEFQVKQDTTSNLPKEIQKEILGSMNEAAPVGWEEINRDYFRRLTEGGESASVDAMAVPAPAAK